MSFVVWNQVEGRPYLRICLRKGNGLLCIFHKTGDSSGKGWTLTMVLLQSRSAIRGSSITQGCSIAVTPLPEIWTVAASVELDMQLYNLGFGGNCHHEPMVARLIRDLPAELISLCFGINVMGGCTLNKRTFQPSVLGFIQTVRDGHPETPIVVLSPIYAPSRERTENQVGLDMCRIRSEIAEAVCILQMRGDRRLIMIHGTELLGESEEGDLPDGIHPDGRGHSDARLNSRHRLH